MSENELPPEDPSLVNRSSPSDDESARLTPPVEKKKEARREFFEAIIFALILALFIRTFVVQAFKIPSGSMIPTLLIGDHILVNKFIYGIPIPFTEKKLIEFKQPARGEVVVFRFPLEPNKDFIKRVVGTPGDVVQMENGRLLVNGDAVPMIPKNDYSYKEHPDGEPIEFELYDEVLGDHPHPVIYTKYFPMSRRSFGPVTVPEGEIFVMGDNRDNSNDSRAWGFVDISAVRGRAINIYWSWDADHWTVRLERLGDFIQ